MNAVATLLPRSLRHQTLVLSRSFATGTRGASGRGWYVTYRAGKGGRHLQGDYHDRESLEARQQWNEAILELGSTQVYMDIVLETKARTTEAMEEDDNSQSRPGVSPVPPLDSLTGEKFRLTMDLASTVMPESVDNFLKICELDEYGYVGSKLYRFERNVGVCGGDVLTNKGKSGLAAPYLSTLTEEQRNSPIMETAEPLRRTIFNDPLALWHVPGTVTMFVQRVGELDSRFLLCTEQAMHMDGIHRAIGQMNQESIDIIKKWEEDLLTFGGGIPTMVDMIVVDCGVVGGSSEKEPTPEAAA